MIEHLGYEMHDRVGAGTGNLRNGTPRGKTVLTEASGPVGDRGAQGWWRHVLTRTMVREFRWCLTPKTLGR